MKNRKVDIFWELAFDKFNLEEQIEDYGSVEISTDEIKSISNPSTGQTFEPRLVTKFDSISDLPKIFKVGDTREVRYSIMSKSRRSYVIVKANLYKKLDAKFKFGADKLNRMSFPTHIKSIDEDSITSEANALNVALFSGIFDEFFNSSNFVQTISGRMGTGKLPVKCKKNWYVHPTGSSKIHPTEKNHKLLEELITDNTVLGDVIYDPCMGSGSTGLVANKLGRKFYGVELDEKYYTIAKERLNNE